MSDWLLQEYRLKRGRNRVAIVDLSFCHDSLVKIPVITQLKIAYRTKRGNVVTDWVSPDALESMGREGD